MGSLERESEVYECMRYGRAMMIIVRYGAFSDAEG